MARTPKKTAAPKAETLSEVVESIKGFDLNFQCRGYQFKVGETYIHDGDVEVCASGFHGIGGNPLEVFNYYPPGQSRYASTTQGGKIARNDNDSKIASASITIHAELNLHDLIGRAVAWIMNAGGAAKTNHAEGNQSAASSTGDRSAAISTGDRSVASSTGYQSAATASGKEGRVMGIKGNALFLVYRDPNTWEILHVWAGLVGQNGIKPNVWYSLGSDGQPIVVEN